MENVQPTITIADVASMISVLEAVSTRGAIRPDEMAAVGELYNRLKTFLDFARAELAQSQGEANA